MMKTENSANIEDIKPGNILFEVNAYPNSKGEIYTNISEMRIVSLPCDERGIGLFAYHEKPSVLDCGETIKCKFSLKDANIIPNHYNIHRVFTDLESAQNYASRICNPDERNIKELEIIDNWVQEMLDEEDYGSFSSYDADEDY